MGSEQTSEATTEVSTQQDESRRSSAASNLLCDYWLGHTTIPSGELTFSGGMLWYSFQKVDVYYDHIGSLSSASFKVVRRIGDDLAQHEWLNDLYVQLLESLGTTDPFYPQYDSMRLYKRMEVPNTKCLIKAGESDRVLLEGPLDYATSVLDAEGGAFMMGIIGVSFFS
jgi:hypothetical protein